MGVIFKDLTAADEVSEDVEKSTNDVSILPHDDRARESRWVANRSVQIAVEIRLYIQDKLCVSTFTVKDYFDWGKFKLT